VCYRSACESAHPDEPLATYIRRRPIPDRRTNRRSPDGGRGTAGLRRHPGLAAAGQARVVILRRVTATADGRTVGRAPAFVAAPSGLSADGTGCRARFHQPFHLGEGVGDSAVDVT
jgi:hypothetical protein